MLGVSLVVASALGSYAQAPEMNFYPTQSAAEAARLRAQLDGVLSLNGFGGVNTVNDSTAGNTFFGELYTGLRTPRQVVPTTGESYSALPFWVGFDIAKDVDAVADAASKISGIVSVNGFGQLSSYPLPTAGEGESPTSAGPHLNYFGDVQAFNARTLNAAAPETTIAGGAQRDVTVVLPYFFFDIARNVEVATDWRQATNAWQGAYILDGLGGIHYINDGEVLAMMKRGGRDAANSGVIQGQTAGTEMFYSIFGFRPIYTQDFRGTGNPPGPAPYFGFDIARDLEIAVRWTQISTVTVANSVTKAALAATRGILDENLSTRITLPASRADFTNPNYGANVAITSGYYILDGNGAVHSLLEDKDGNPVPAAWEDAATGNYASDLTEDIPWFGFDIAEDLEILPNQNGFALLNSFGSVFFLPGHATNGTPLNLSDVVKTSAFTNNDPSGSVPFFGFDVARGLKLVEDSTGMVTGFYVIDAFGEVHAAGEAVPITSDKLPTFTFDIARDVEVSPFYRPITGPQS